jgi:hypothetical protein
MSQLLLFYYIEAHTDRVVASAFCTALFARWLEKRRQQYERRRSATGLIGHHHGGGDDGGCWGSAPPAFSTLPQSPVPQGAGAGVGIPLAAHGQVFVFSLQFYE